MTDADDRQDNALEVFFEAARATPPPVPADLMARVQADAGDVQPAAPKRATGWVQALGGLPGLGGLVTAACIGVWIGVAPPQQLPDIGALALGLQEASAEDTAGFGWDIEIEEG